MTVSIFFHVLICCYVNYQINIIIKLQHCVICFKIIPYTDNLVATFFLNNSSLGSYVKFLKLSVK